MDSAKQGIALRAHCGPTLSSSNLRRMGSTLCAHSMGMVKNGCKNARVQDLEHQTGAEGLMETDGSVG